jgi:hypothetical protein
MLGMLALMAVTLAGANDEAMCTARLEEMAVEQILAAAEADLYEADVYANAEADFDARLDEVGLAGSTLGREEAHAMADARGDGRFVARNR